STSPSIIQTHESEHGIASGIQSTSPSIVQTHQSERGIAS
ncbi:hypothetical protein NPIL_350331, partial [Nephila pilipes]